MDLRHQLLMTITTVFEMVKVRVVIFNIFKQKNDCTKYVNEQILLNISGTSLAYLSQKMASKISPKPNVSFNLKWPYI